MPSVVGEMCDADQVLQIRKPGLLSSFEMEVQ